MSEKVWRYPPGANCDALPNPAPADDLVTEEMIEKCLAAAVAAAPDGERSAITACLRAVAPMIAARERECCAQIVEGARYDDFVSGYIAPAIRARGESTS
jgi:hypothetical protein